MLPQHSPALAGLFSYHSQFGDAQSEPFHAMPGEIDPRSGVVAAAFEHLYPALAELSVEDIHSALQAVRSAVPLFGRRCRGKPAGIVIFGAQRGQPLRGRGW